MEKKPLPRGRNATILDVAHEADVSKSTVSLVLQGSPLIRQTTANRVREAAQKLGYVYNRSAAELRRKTSNRIGVIINDLMNPFFAEILVGLERKLVDAGYVVFMAHTSESLERQQDLLIAMREQATAGIALCPALGTDSTVIDTVESWGIPLVVLIRELDDAVCDFAGADNERGVAMATKHLIDQKHARIGFIGGQPSTVFRQRRLGYQRALKAAGRTYDKSLVLQCRPTRSGGYEAMSRLLDTQPNVTAAVCYNDLVAFGALSALGERGLHAGTDFALVGFDNVLATAHSNPPLTTIDVHPSELGESAASILLSRIQDPSKPIQRFLSTPELVRRMSA